ncbi:MAG: Coq4 family protein [Moheibacter sp.]
MNIRLNFMLWLYGWSQILYTRLFKRNKKEWGITLSKLLLYPEGSLGKALGEFYQENDFQIMPKLENHDVFHIITETGTEIQDEIAMQYLLLGNGKFSLYLLGMVFIGSLLYPEFISHYIKSFKKGKKMLSFYSIDFGKLLDYNLISLKIKFNSQHKYCTPNHNRKPTKQPLIN